MLVAEDKKGLYFEIKGLAILSSLTEHVYCAQVWHLPLHKRALSRTWSHARVVQVLFVLTSQVYVWPWTAVNLLTLRMFNKSHYLLGSFFIHFLICEWNDSHDMMLLSSAVSWRYKKLKIQSTRQRFNWKKLRVPPWTVGITADYVQFIIHTGLCRVRWLLVFVHWAVWVTEWAIVTATGCSGPQ